MLVMLSCFSKSLKQVGKQYEISIPLTHKKCVEDLHTL